MRGERRASGERLVARPVARPGSRRRLAGLEDELGRIVEASEVPGAAVALVARGSAWSRGFGTADLSTGRPVTPETLFRTNSVSKSLVSLAALRRPPPAIAARLALGHSFLAALACAALVLYLADWGWLGLRTWAY